MPVSCLRECHSFLALFWNGGSPVYFWLIGGGFSPFPCLPAPLEAAPSCGLVRFMVESIDSTVLDPVLWKEGKPEVYELQGGSVPRFDLCLIVFTIVRHSHSPFSETSDKCKWLNICKFFSKQTTDHPLEQGFFSLGNKRQWGSAPLPISIIIAHYTNAFALLWRQYPHSSSQRKSS